MFNRYIDQQDDYTLHRMGPKPDLTFESSKNVDCSEQRLEKELLFCKVAHQQDGKIDSLWKNVVIDAADEITAHTSLFSPGCHYEGLVDQVGDVIAGWVFDSLV
jgi:hypothetical protein